jgi:hypothetical protein
LKLIFAIVLMVVGLVREARARTEHVSMCTHCQVV